MQIITSRFGAIQIEPDDILLFPTGLPGLEQCQHWVVLADADNESLGWLQSISKPEIAMPVVSPRRFVPGYQVRVFRGELQPLQLQGLHDAQVLAVVSKNNENLTLNLKAPVIINLERRLGRQVVVNDDQPLQFILAPPRVQLRKSA